MCKSNIRVEGECACVFPVRLLVWQKYHTHTHSHTLITRLVCDLIASYTLRPPLCVFSHFLISRYAFSQCNCVCMCVFEWYLFFHHRGYRCDVCVCVVCLCRWIIKHSTFLYIFCLFIHFEDQQKPTGNMNMIIFSIYSFSHITLTTRWCVSVVLVWCANAPPNTFPFPCQTRHIFLEFPI